jgi:hypothetical protein
MAKPSKKKEILEKLFKHCRERNNFVFNNEVVRELSGTKTNHFDITKLDNTRRLPDILLENDFAVIHLGGGRHKFVRGISKVFHEFEIIEQTIKWDYKKSILNLLNTSESNILSIANNQRILHHFLFEQDTEFNNTYVLKRPKTYFPHRTNTHLEYYFGAEKIVCDKLQIEIDLTIEFQGTVGIFEAKNGRPSNFNIYQLYHPFLYYYNASQTNETLKNKISNIFAVYLVRQQMKSGNTLKLWKYTFEKPFDMTSIKCLKSATYQLIRNNDNDRTF